MLRTILGLFVAGASLALGPAAAQAGKRVGMVVGFWSCGPVHFAVPVIHKKEIKAE